MNIPGIATEDLTNEDLAAEAVDAPAPEPTKRTRTKKAVDPEAAAKKAEEKAAKEAERAAKKAAREEAKANKAPRSYRIPRDGVLTVLVKENPKRAGSAAHARFEGYFADGVKTVQDALNNGLTPADLFHDIGHGFISVEGYPVAAE